MPHSDDLRRARERIEIARANLRRLDGASGERIEQMRAKLAAELRQAERDAAWLAVQSRDAA
jgi:chaperonin cofactor prefoldin